LKIISNYILLYFLHFLIFSDIFEEMINTSNLTIMSFIYFLEQMFDNYIESLPPEEKHKKPITVRVIPKCDENYHNDCAFVNLVRDAFSARFVDKELNLKDGIFNKTDYDSDETLDSALEELFFNLNGFNLDLNSLGEPILTDELRMLKKNGFVSFETYKP